MFILTLLLILQSDVSSGKNASVQQAEKKSKEYVVKNEWEESFLQGEKLLLNLKNSELIIIDIQPWERNFVRIECVKKIKYAGFNIEEIRLGDIALKIKRGRNLKRVTVKFNRDGLIRNRCITYGVGYYINIKLPKYADIELNGNNGLVSIHNIYGKVDVNVKEGEILCELDSLSNNPVRLNLGKGDITLKTKMKPESIFAKTEEGEIKSSFPIDTLDPKASLKLLTTSGNIYIQEIKE